MPSAMEECREPSGKCRGISQSLEREKLAGFTDLWNSTLFTLNVTLWITRILSVILNQSTERCIVWSTTSTKFL